MVMERIVKRYYDELENGKVLGRRCTACGAVEYPPVLACNTCGHLETEWMEMSGNGVIMDFVPSGPATSSAENKDLGKYCYATIHLEEGPEITGLVLGVSKKNEPVLREMQKNGLPIRVKMAITQREGYKTVFFKLVDSVDAE